MKKRIAKSVAALAVAGGLAVGGAATASAGQWVLYKGHISSYSACEDYGTYGQQHGSWLAFYCTKPNPAAGWQLYVEYY